jgi:glycosyltransferase involved in cell wall biosynthesis
VSPRRILIVSSHFPPDRSAGTHRVLRLANHLQRHGCETSVLTLAPESYRRSIQLDEGLIGRADPDLVVVRTRAWRGATHLIRWRNSVAGAPMAKAAAAESGEGTPAKPRSTSGWKALRRRVATGLFGFPDDEVGWLGPAILRGVQTVRRLQIDTVLTSAPPFTCHLIGHAIRSLCDVRWVADFRDPWSRAPWGRPGSARGHQWLEARVIARADAVVLNTPELHREFSQFYGPETSRRFHVVTNGFDADLLEPYARACAPPTPPLVLTHAGNLYGARNPLPLLEAVAQCIRDGRVPPDGLRLDLVGKIAPAFQVEAAIRRLGLDGVVTITPPVAHESALQRLAASHVLVVIQPDTALQVPAKLYEYVGLRRRILALAEEGAVARVVREGDFGDVVPPADVDRIASALSTLYRERDSLVRTATANRSVQQFDARTQSRLMSEILTAVGETRPCTSSTWFSTSTRPTIPAGREPTSSPGAGPPRGIG